MNLQMLHRTAPQSSQLPAEDVLQALVSFHPGPQPLASCRPLGLWFADELTTVELHLAGPSGARVEQLKTTLAYARLRWGNLAAGRWTAAAAGFDRAGVARWRAPHVRFRVGSGDLSQVNLHFQKVGS